MTRRSITRRLQQAATLRLMETPAMRVRFGADRESDQGMSRPIRVLFVCTHNSARSQMAEALLRREGGPQFEAVSAGTQATRVHPPAGEALPAGGVDWSGAPRKSGTQFLNHPLHYVLTVCDRAPPTCPGVP